MPAYAENITTVLAVGALLLGAGCIAVLVYRFLFDVWVPKGLERYVVRYGLWGAAALALAALLLSLWYSEGVGIPTCPLCWFARTMMYPLAIILPLAAWHADRAVTRYVLPITGVGLAITGYHHLLQMNVVSEAACSVLNEGATCNTRYVFEFGFVTMPLFGFILFGAIALCTYVVHRLAHKEG